MLEAVIPGPWEDGEGAAGDQLQTRGAGCSPGSQGGSPPGRGNSLCKGPGAGGNEECLRTSRMGERQMARRSGAERRKVRCHGPGVLYGSSQFFVLRAKGIFTQEAGGPLPRSRSAAW